jgi:hypothetical protein
LAEGGQKMDQDTDERNRKLAQPQCQCGMFALRIQPQLRTSGGRIKEIVTKGEFCGGHQPCLSPVGI